MPEEIPTVSTEPQSLMMKIRPTAAERAAGRLMRAPDHGAGDGGDQGGDNGQAADAAKGGADGGSDAGQSDGGSAQGDGGEDASLLGGAGAEAGSGDGGEDDGKGGKAGKDGDGAADAPPEAYDLKLMVKDAEGNDSPVEMDAALVEAATPILKEVGLNNDQANKLVGLVPQIQSRLIEQQADDHSALKAQWAKDVQADKEIGGKNWTETEALAAKALDHFGAPSEKDAEGNETNPFRVLLNETGLGNHPEMVRMFRKIGAAVGEDSTVRGDGAAVHKVDRLEVLYPDDVPEKSKQGA